jgi:transcriptional regulator with XRE-family HTH domain
MSSQDIEQVPFLEATPAEEDARQENDEAQTRVRRAFGKVLKAARTHCGISQQTLADNAGADRSYLSMLERGLQQPTLAMLLKIAKALNLDPEKMVTATLERIQAEDASASTQGDRQAA